MTIWNFILFAIFNNPPLSKARFSKPIFSMMKCPHCCSAWSEDLAVCVVRMMVPKTMTGWRCFIGGRGGREPTGTNSDSLNLQYEWVVVGSNVLENACMLRCPITLASVDLLSTGQILCSSGQGPWNIASYKTFFSTCILAVWKAQRLPALAERRQKLELVVEEVESACRFGGVPVRTRGKAGGLVVIVSKFPGAGGHSVKVMNSWLLNSVASIKSLWAEKAFGHCRSWIWESVAHVFFFFFIYILCLWLNFWMYY